jgi:ParB family transcriptional regulator, chromosome partitioning protein
VGAGDSNATVAKRLGMNLTTVAQHLALFDLPPELDQALKSGRCTSPRTLHELSKLHGEEPEQVRALVVGDAEITRAAVSAIRAQPTDPAAGAHALSSPATLIAQANVACDLLERALGRLHPSNSCKLALPELIALRIRVEDLTKRWLQGSDRQSSVTGSRVATRCASPRPYDGTFGCRRTRQAQSVRYRLAPPWAGRRLRCRLNLP